MIYFKQNNDVIEKYEIYFDKEQVENLNKEIINNCSLIEHNEYESDYSPRFYDWNLIKNYSSKITSKSKEYFEETRDIYIYSYDEYKPPYLVSLVKKLLAGDALVIDQILNYNATKIVSIDDKINMVNQKLINTSSTDIRTKKELLEKLEELLKLKENNKNQKSEYEYYNKLISLIKFDLVDSISLKELNRVEAFLEIKLVNKNDKSVEKQKVLTKIN